MNRGFATRIAPAGVFVGVFFLVPLCVLLAYSFGRSTLFSLEFGFHPENYLDVIESNLYRDALGRSLWIGAAVGLISVVLAFPFAYAITLGALRRYGEILLFLILVSLFSAYIVRVYAWRTLLGRNGVINTALESVGLLDGPLSFLLYNKFAVILTFVNVLVPLAVLPIYAALTDLDRQVLEAARTLGCSPMRTLLHVTLPLASRGIMVGFILCFVVAAGDYVTPQLVGGPSGSLVGNIIVARFGVAFDWPLGSALAFVLVASMALLVLALSLVLRSVGLRDRPR